MALAVVVAAFFAIGARPVEAADDRLHVDVRFETVDPQIEQRLIDSGFEIELSMPELGRWQGWLPAHLLDNLRALEGVASVRTPRYASFAAGDTLTEGDELLNAASARRRFNVDGSGVRVAVISDGIVGLDEAIRADEAPRLAEARPFGGGSLDRGEEGTAMIEIVHDLAPGASISFGAVYTDLDHIAAVKHFAKKVDIIVDDVSFAFPGNQRSDVSLNTTRALRHPEWPLRLYVTAAGNWAESHWTGLWQAGPDGSLLGLPSSGAVHQFNDSSGAESLFGAGNSFNVDPDDEIRLALFWDDLWGRSTNDYNLYLLSGVGEILASSQITQAIGVDNHDPREHLTYTHEGEATELFAVIQNRNDDAQPVTFDLFGFRGNGEQLRLNHRTPQGSILAQSDAEDALTVGAVNVGRQSVAAYSSRGPTINGAPKPELSAVDGVSVSETTHFGPRFSGSSAAAPHVAGVAALLLQAQPALRAGDGGNPLLERRLIRDILIETASDIPPDGADPASGAGLIDADGALEMAATVVAVVESSSDDGPGSFRAAIASGASIVLFSEAPDQRRIILGSELPILGDGLTIDATGWTLDASGVSIGLRIGDDTELWGLSLTGAQRVGIVIAGDSSRLVDVTVDDNEVGIRVDGEDAMLERVRVLRGRTNGVEVSNHASVAISASEFDANQGAGVRIAPAAGDVTIGPDSEPPTPAKASELHAPIGALESAFPLPRSGLSHTIIGSVSRDGLPASQGTRVDVYLDRRLTASVAVDQAASFRATVTGPGTELRFAVDGAAAAQRVKFEAGARTTITLRAVSPLKLLAVGTSDEHVAGANLFRNNLTGIEIVAGTGESGGRRFIWGNLMQRNRTNVTSSLSTPTISEVSWSASGLSLYGNAEGAEVAHLYAGTAGERRFVGAATTVQGQFAFEHLDIASTATEFSVIAHSADGIASPESKVHTAPTTGSIASITPDSGYVDGGESVQICGNGIATDAEAPRVWFGNLSARVIFWSGECVTVLTPRYHVGPADVALLLNRSRPIVALEAFEYRTVRVVSLKQGRNFVTWTGSDTRVTTAFSSLAGATFRAYAWDGNAQQWQIFSTDLPARLNTLRTLKHDQPLWILLDSEDIDWEQPAPD